MLSTVNVDNEYLSPTSNYSSAQSAAISNTAHLYRPYDINTSNNQEWPTNVSYNPVFAANVSSNVMGGYADSTFPWPYAPDPTYQSYPHFPNWWNQYYYQQAAYGAHYDQRQAVAQAVNVFDGSNVSSSVWENAPSLHPPTAPYAPSIFSQPTTFATEPTSFPYPSYQQVSYQAANAYPPSQQLPIRPVPQQVVAEPAHQCKACLRWCSSAGGLKRHANFCSASQSNIDEILASYKEQNWKVPEANRLSPGRQTLVTEEKTHNQTELECPINLSSSATNNPSSPLGLTSSECPLLCTPPPSASGPCTTSAWNPSPLNISNVQSSCDPSTPSTLSSLPIPLIEGHSQPAQTDDTFQEIDFNLERENRPSKELTSLRNRSQKQCPHCPSVFPSERAFVEHLATHNGKPYSCSTCGGHFSRKFHLTRHIKQRGCDGRPRAQFPCGLCGKAFSRKDNLREHIKGHTGQGRVRPKLPCPIPTCNKKFLSRIQLHTHLNFHTDQRPYVCTHELCNKSFRSRAALRKHSRTHQIADHSYRCFQCNAQFGVKEHLDQHMATHVVSDAEDPLCLTFKDTSAVNEQASKDQQGASDFYACTLCRRRYQRRWRLQQHYRLVHCEKSKPTDTNETDEVTLLGEFAPRKSFSFVCDICQKGFISKSSLKVHYLTHPVEGPINCPECHKGFMRRECLLRHLRSKHRMPTILAVQAIQAAQAPILQDQRINIGQSGQANDVMSYSTVPAYCLPFQTSNIFSDTLALEANILELLSLLVDSSALKNFGWPEKSVDSVLQAVLIKCGKEPSANDNDPLIQRLRSNVKHLFSFIVDDQTALETLFERRSIEQVLEQVIKLAKSNDSNNNVVQISI